MAGIRKISIIGSLILVSGLFLVLGGYKVRSILSIHNRPWLLEADLRERLSQCRKGPISSFYREELKLLETHLMEAEMCSVETDGRMWLRRDYSDCISMLFSAEAEVKLLSLEMQQREKVQNNLVKALLPSLNLVLSGNGKTRKVWERFDLNSIEAERARKLLKEATNLYSRNEIEPALNAAFGAWDSWNRFTRTNDSKFARFLDPLQRRKWDQQAERLLQWTKKSGRRAIIVDKFEHICLLINRGRVQKRYKAELGRQWYNRKSRSRDASTPEGEYLVTRLIPRGKYGQALLINYPNAEDEARFQSLKRKGMIPAGARIGGSIEIHGSGEKETDWTDGCISLKDDHMRELYGFAYTGMPVTIVGTSRWATDIGD